MSKEIKSLLLPWVCVVVLALGSSVAFSVFPSATTSSLSSMARWVVPQQEQHDHRDLNSNEFSELFENNNYEPFEAKAETTGFSRFLTMARMNSRSLFPLETSDILGFFFATLGLIVAAGGGIGGGGILVPVYILVMRLGPKHAIPLSNVTVFGGAVANTILNWKKRHPLADRPLIDWDLILVMEPLTIAGSLIGAFLNKVLPELLLVILLVILLTFTARKTLKKAYSLYQKENDALEKLALLDGNTTAKTNYGSTTEAAEDSQETDIENSDSDVDKEKQTKLQEILERESKPSVHAITVLFVTFGVVLIVNLLKGGGGHSLIGIQCGSLAFWMANVGMIAWIVFVFIYVRNHLIKEYKEKIYAGFKYVEGDVQWDEKRTMMYPSLCCLAGFFAGMFGIGGGIVKGPLMLAMGVHPGVSSATSACMILFTSFTATTSFVVFGLLLKDYAAICFVIGFVATFAGQILLAKLMGSYGGGKVQRNSYIAFSIGAVVLLSAILMTVQSGMTLVRGLHGDFNHHSDGGVCGGVGGE